MKYIISMVMIGISLSIFFLYTRPSYDGLQKSQAQLAVYEDAINKIKTLDQKRDQLIGQNNAFDQTALDRLNKMLPDHVDNISLILDFNGVASQYNMSLQSINVGTSVGSSSSGVVASIQSDEHYQPFQMSFSVQGPYDTLLSFLGDLQTSLRVVDITSLSLSPSGQQQSTDPGQQGQRLYTLAVNLNTYWMK